MFVVTSFLAVLRQAERSARSRRSGAFAPIAAQIRRMRQAPRHDRRNRNRRASGNPLKLLQRQQSRGEQNLHGCLVVAR